MASSEIGDVVRMLAARQDGVVTTAQLVAAGAHRSWASDRVLSGVWQRLHRGVLVTHSGPILWATRARAALLYAGCGAALSHHSAALVWGFVRTEPRLVDVSVPADRRVMRSDGLVVHLRRNSPEALGRLRATAPEETVVDLVAASSTVDDAVGWIGRAVLAGVHPVHALQAAGRRRRFRHRGLLLDLLADGDLGSESALEHRYHRDVERRHGLPLGRQQVRQARPCGRRCTSPRCRVSEVHRPWSPRSWTSRPAARSSTGSRSARCRTT